MHSKRERNLCLICNKLPLVSHDIPEEGWEKKRGALAGFFNDLHIKRPANPFDTANFNSPTRHRLSLFLVFLLLPSPSRIFLFFLLFFLEIYVRVKSGARERKRREKCNFKGDQRIFFLDFNPVVRGSVSRCYRVY